MFSDIETELALHTELQVECHSIQVSLKVSANTGLALQKDLQPLQAYLHLDDHRH